MQLVINSFGASLRRHGEMFRVVCDGRHVDLPAKRVSTILVTAGAHFSSDAINLALEHNSNVVLLDKFGTPTGRFWLTKMGSTAAIRRAQIATENTPQGTEIVKRWTAVKLHNQCDFLRELGRRRPQRQDEFDNTCGVIEKQEKQLTALNSSLDEARHQILGFEGTSAATYWKLIGSLPPANFQFSKRSFRPARDAFNAMLNYAYGVLYSEVERACIIAGLDPFVGFLHTDNYNKQSLVFDMIEPFRIWADRTVTKLFTGRRCKEGMFEVSRDGVVLQKEAKELLLSNLEDHLEEPVRYQVKSSRKKKTRQIKRRKCIQAEAHTLANRLLGKEGGLPEIMETKEVFGDSGDEEGK